MLSNIEPIARAICARQLAKHCKSDAELAADVDRFWPCVAAQLEGGLVDNEGNALGPYDYWQEIKSYRDYAQRHKTR